MGVGCGVVVTRKSKQKSSIRGGDHDLGLVLGKGRNVRECRDLLHLTEFTSDGLCW